MVAPGRASAWGGAPHSCSPGAGRARGRGSSPAPPAHGPGGGHRGSPERPTRREPPLSSAREACGVPAEETARGERDSLVGAGAATTCLCWSPNVVCVTVPSGPGPVHVPQLPGRELPRAVGSKEPGPSLWALPFRVRSGQAGGQAGRMELPEVRVPCPALSTCHCMQPVGAQL